MRQLCIQPLVLRNFETWRFIDKLIFAIIFKYHVILEKRAELPQRSLLLPPPPSPLPFQLHVPYLQDPRRCVPIFSPLTQIRVSKFATTTYSSLLGSEEPRVLGGCETFTGFSAWPSGPERCSPTKPMVCNETKKPQTRQNVNCLFLYDSISKGSQWSPLVFGNEPRNRPNRLT